MSRLRTLDGIAGRDVLRVLAMKKRKLQVIADNLAEVLKFLSLQCHERIDNARAEGKPLPLSATVKDRECLNLIASAIDALEAMVNS